MGMHPRQIKTGVVCAQTQRTIDRQFLFKPDPVTRNIIGASASRAQIKFPVLIYWLECNINHEQLGIAPIDDSQESLTNVVRFKQLFHRLIVEEINRYLKREGGMFSTPSRNVDCIDDESAQNQFEYALTNPVKDGLVDRIRHWGGFSSYGALASGSEVDFTWVDRTAWHHKGGERSRKPPEAFTKTIRLEYTPLPGTEHLSPQQRQTMIRKRCREIEQSFREEREREGRNAMTHAAMEKVDHRDRPKTHPPKTRKPLCHCACPMKRKKYREDHREFLHAYRVASIVYRSGNYNVVFPTGSFKPPLIVAAA